MKKRIVLLLAFLLFSHQIIDPVSAKDSGETFKISASKKNKKFQENDTLVVLDFENNTGLTSIQHLQKGLADSLTNRLNSLPDSSLEILERSRIKEAMQELSFNQSGFVSKEKAVELGKTIGAKFILLGSVVKSGDLFEVGVRLVDTETSKIIFGKAVLVSGEEAILNSTSYLSLAVADNLGQKIEQKQLLEEQKKIESYQKSEEKNNHLTYFILGGVVVVVGLVTAVVFALGGGQKQENNNTINIGI